MGYTIALASPQAQAEGNGGGAGAWTYNLTRNGADTNAGAQVYSFHVFNTDTTPSDDFLGTTGGNNTFTWAGGSTAMSVTFTAVQDFAVEANETPIIWFFSDNTSLGTPILRNNDIAANVLTITNDDTGPPVFSTAAAFSAAENSTAAGTVTAASGGTAVTYAITGGADQLQFTVNATTGVLTWAANNLKVPTTPNTDGVYLVQVTATAGGTTTAQDLSITLSNANETPTITSNGGGAAATGVGTINENTTAVLVATSADVDVGDTRTWSISGGADASKFVINGTTGALSFASAPNFEAHADAGANDIFDVTIRITDAGGLFTDQTVAVALGNVNDPAVISSYGGASLLLLHAPENTLTTTTLATVTATDNDVGGTITYGLMGPDSGRFAVSAGGLLTFAPSPDFELPGDSNGDNVYDVTVRATAVDGGAPADQRFLVFVDNVVETGESGGGGGGFTPPTPPTPPPAPVAPQGTAGDDNLSGTPGNDDQRGGDGNDVIDAGAGDDDIDGDNGNDYLVGGAGIDFIRGLADNDTVQGGDDADTVNGNTGDDSASGGNGADVVYGGQGQDQVSGGEGNDSYVNGNIGNDTVHGDGGNDSVYGGQNDDMIYGDAGNDLLSGDLGNDLLYGGAGADRFTSLATGGSDWIGDFNGAEGDRIQLAPGTSYTIGMYQNQVLITIGGTATIGLAGVSTFDPSWIVFA